MLLRRPLAATATALLAALLPAGLARAVDVADGQLSLHGDGEWAYQKTWGKNTFDEGTPEGNYDTAMFDLVVTARPVENLVISAQLGFDSDRSSAEWVFAEWRFSDLVRLRVGKVQQPFGNLNELRFAGTTRPFYDLPYAVYGPANVVGTSYQGLGATGQITSDAGWTFAYDLYGGGVILGEAEPYTALIRPGSPEAALPVEVEEQQVRNLVGGRVSVTTPGELTFRLSGFAGSIKHGEDTDTYSSAGLSAQYRGDRLWLSAEAFRSSEADSEVTLTAYGTVAWMVTEQLQVAAQYEWAETRYAGSPASDLLRHQSLGLGLAWWVNPNLVFKACYHRIQGNRFAYPEGATPNDLVGYPASAGGTYDPSTIPSPRTDAFTLGTQFAF